MSELRSDIKKDSEFLAREDFHKNLLRKTSGIGDKLKLGGGEKAIEKLHAKGKLHCRERINLLIDEGSYFHEIGLFTGYGMYEEYGGAPSSGTVFGIGKIHGRNCVIVANDATVKAGAWFPITCKKNLRAQEISIENKLPI